MALQQIQNLFFLLRIHDAIDDPAFLAVRKAGFMLQHKLEVFQDSPRLCLGYPDDAIQNERIFPIHIGIPLDFH